MNKVLYLGTDSKGKNETYLFKKKQTNKQMYL